MSKLDKGRDVWVRFGDVGLAKCRPETRSKAKNIFAKVCLVQ